MCGIIGYIGTKPTVDILINGLKRLEYRGYDSAGIAVLDEHSITVHKAKGKIHNLEKKISNWNTQSTIGMGHTRWATHGEPSEINAHPHWDDDQRIFVIHNGIIDNYDILKQHLIKKGHTFRSDTDTEILAHLFAEYYTGNLQQTVTQCLSKVEGTYGICVMSVDEPDILIGARRGSPLIVGIGDNESFLASDVSAILSYTNKVIYIEDNEVVKLNRNQAIITNLNRETIEKEIQGIDWNLEQIEKSGYEHFMLKEIHEQPETLLNAFRGRIVPEEGKVQLGGLNMENRDLREIQRIILVACGTSWHAALVGEYLIEQYAEIPVEVEYASEFRYRNPILNPNDLVIVISQSGETADTLAALREAKQKGVRVLGITNIVGSTIARETNGGVYIHAGPEIGVASTKAFTSQLMVLSLLAIRLGRLKQVSSEEGFEFLHALQNIPNQVREVLAGEDAIKSLAKNLCHHSNFLYLGRGVNYPTALEGALKLKEISYIHAEGYPAAEMKHGPIALIDENMPVVFIANDDHIYEKIIHNMEEVKARKGILITVTNSTKTQISELSDHVIHVPKTLSQLSPIINIIPLQLLAYYIAVERGCDVDQPRNLAKSVTVE